MKKLIFILVLALCAGLACAALAENASCCCCSRQSEQSEQNVQSEQSEQNEQNEQSEQSESPYAFTYAVEMGNFVAYVPFGVEEKQHQYIIDGCAITILAAFRDYPDVYYYTETAQERYEALKAELEASGEPGVEIAWADECVGTLETTQEHGWILALDTPDVDYTLLSFVASNRRELIMIYVQSENAQAATALMRGILEHIVAPEMPLEDPAA